MNVNEIYENKKKSFLFNDSNEFQILRKKLIEKFDLSPKNIRNNESLKHLDLNVLKFNYEYQTIVNDIEYHDNKEDFIKLLKNMGYIIIKKESDILFKYKPKKEKKTFIKKTQKESPFGVLKKLSFN